MCCRRRGWGWWAASRDRTGQPGADGVPGIARALLPDLHGAALRRGIGVAGADGGPADRPAVHGAAAAGHSRYPPGADLPPRNGRAADVGACVVETRCGFGDFGGGDPRVCRPARGVAERERTHRASTSRSRWPPDWPRWLLWRWCCCGVCAGSAAICRGGRDRSCVRVSRTFIGQGITRARL